MTRDNFCSSFSVYKAHHPLFLLPSWTNGKVHRLVELLSAKKMGVVAHFYMDPEVRKGWEWNGMAREKEPS